MPSLSVVLKKKLSNGLYSVNIRIIHNRKPNYIGTDFKVAQNQFSNGRIKNHPNAKIINDRLASKLSLYERALDEIGYQLPTMPVAELKQYLLSYEAKANNSPLTTKAEPPEFFKFSEEVLAKLTVKYEKKLKATGKASKSIINNYKSCVKSIQEFNKKDKLYFSQIDKKFLEGYKAHLAEKGLKNGIWNKFKDFRALYNRAVDEELITLEKYPFRKMRINAMRKQGEPQVLSVREMREFMAYQPETEVEELAKDVFLLSFYLIGVNPIDLYYLEKPEGAKIQGGRFVFSRSKTDVTHSIKIQPEATKLLEKLHTPEGYIFQLRYKTNTSFYTNINQNGLLKISEKLGFSVQLTLGVARHTWATIAYNDLDIAESVIDFALGHKTQRTIAGAHYIKKDRAKMDAANRSVIDYLVQ